jgi:hypothetical protein
MRRFWISLFLFTAIAQGPFALGLGLVLGRLGAPAWPAAGAALLGVWALRGRLLRAFRDRPLPAWRRALVEEPYFAHWCAAGASLPIFAVLAALLGLHAAVAGAAGLGARLGAAGLGAYLAGLAVSGYGVFVRRRWVRVRTVEIAVAGLPAAFEGYRIALLSDLHIGGLSPSGLAARWVEAVRAEGVDLVALAGDYVTHGDAFHGEIARVLGAMEGRDGVVAVLGNHDYMGDAEHLAEAIGATRVTLLRNQQLTLTRGGEALTIAGVDDTWSRSADVRRALAGIPAGRTVVALAHDPQLFPALARGGAALTLSGHTHWGQIAVPFLATRYNLSRLSYRYHAGLYREGESALYISPGLGTTGPPLRLGAPPEISVIRLRRAERTGPG